MANEYVYKTKGDKIRVKIFPRYPHHSDSKHGIELEWDIDIWTDSNTVTTVGCEIGDWFATKREAKKYVENQHGKLYSLGSIETVTKGWKNQK